MPYMCKGPTRAERNSEARHPREAGIRERDFCQQVDEVFTSRRNPGLRFATGPLRLRSYFRKRRLSQRMGRRGKERIFDKVLFQEKKTLLVLNFYKTVIPLLKSYACLFQSSEPLIHKLIDKQELLRQFLSNFVYPEKNLGGAKLATHELSKDMSQLMKRTAMVCGEQPYNASRNSRCVVYSCI